MLLGGAGIREPSEVAIEDEVAAIGDEGLLVEGVTPLGSTAELREGNSCGLPAELGDLDRYRRVLAEAFDQLFLIDDNDQPVAGRGDNLFSQ